MESGVTRILGSSRLSDARACALTVGDNGPKVGSFINLNFGLVDDCVLGTACQCSPDFATP